ncbi:transglutaminase domain-containing protein [Papillibacter cinnamivorans]|uniref:Transglutaminase-like superfamily protein n=1 Tax=Papillibacter cinnamivorans DSM 12816 TaxID=1122930 RepID=A0A1W2BGF4_9FIRM|nr:transglutaminase domain-containing protein [Papillibacter cinnamivorans]SMC72067.1 Transglutaminase-like superfamily protein [Papillibacter cinnamivorans DSM 12816]
MKKRVFCLVLLLAVPLSGCSLLDRNTLSVEPHAEQYVEESSVLRAGNYQELVNAILYLVSEASEEGKIRLYDYQGDVDADVAAACLEVTRDDPLGAYAVDYMTSEYDRIMSYYEVSVKISYRRDAQQIRAVKNATGSSAIREEIQTVLLKFGPELALRITYFTEDESYIQALVKSAYYDSPQAAFGMPEVTVSLYPDSGTQRVVEIRLTYPLDADVLEKMKEQTAAEAWEMVSRLSPMTDEKKVGDLYDILIAATEYDTGTEKASAQPGFVKNNAYNAYGALVEGKALSEGYALAFRLLCSAAGIDCQVVQGTVKGAEHFWNIVELDGRYYHVDTAMGDLQGSEWFLMRSDDEMENSYKWDREQYPACVSSPVE